MNLTDCTDELAQARETLTSKPESLVELRPLPAIAMRVSRACSDQDVDIKALTNLVECDAAFAAKILAVVNSSVYGYSREVSSIRQALVVLGRKTISQLAISIAAQKVFSSGEVAKKARMELYEHSLACASVAQSIVHQQSLDIDTGTAFLAGMLHDVGKLILLDVAPVAYPKILNQELAGANALAAEQESFGTDHTTLGTMFGNAWELATPIRKAISNHHMTDSDDEEDLLPQTIGLANQLAKIWGIGREAIEPQCEFAIHWLEKNDEAMQDRIKIQATQRFEEAKALLAS